MLIDIVGEYGKEIPYLLKKLTAMHVDDDKRYTADMIFSTVHRCKGMEYDSITLADDFITRERVRKLVEKGRHEPVDISRISEEINLAYVAVTRSRNFLEFPECMFPDADATLFAKRKIRDIVGLPKRRTGTPPASRRPAAGNAYKSWTKEEDKELLDLFGRGRSLLALAERFGRKQSAIRSRLSKLSWVD
jgi:superfamily I DNA/RNA helicase